MLLPFAFTKSAMSKGYVRLPSFKSRSLSPCKLMNETHRNRRDSAT